MAVTEAQRRALFVKLEALVGEDSADHLMQLLPRTPGDELATRTDVLSMAGVLRGEMAELRAELRGEMTELRTELQGEMTELRAELRGEMTELRAELRGEMTELRADVRTQLAGMQRWMAGVMAANAVAVIAALVT